MARYTGPKRKLSRREGVALFAKDERFLEKKGAVPPGQHGRRGSRKASNFGLQLREKQKTKRLYGVLERQFRLLFEKAARQKGQTGETLLSLLERRLDNIVYRLGFAPSRMMSRQLVNHGHVFVNGKKVTIPSYQVKPKEVISLSAKAIAMPVVKAILQKNKDEKLPDYLERKAAVGQLVSLPKRQDIETTVAESMIVEFYSR